MFDNKLIDGILDNNVISTDSYKFSHWLQYPPKTTNVSSYIESRGLSNEVKDEWDDELLFFGLQGYLKRYLMKPITKQEVDEVEKYCKGHGVPFNREGFDIILNEYDGFYPVEIQALPEGMVLPSGHAQVQITATDPRLYWVPSFLETALLRAVWYPTTVATQSREIKKVIASYLKETAGTTDGLEFMLHDFGARGVSSKESAGIGCGAHLVNFFGTDTGEGNFWLKALYDAPMAGFSVPASEHSTMTSWGGSEGEVEACRNMLRQFEGKFNIISVVSDSYDIYSCIDDIWGNELKKDVQNLQVLGSKLVVRPDSGDPTTVPVECINRLMDTFGYTLNEYGYKVLPPYIGVLQGDGIDIKSIRQILQNMKDAGLSAQNIVFGMGGHLLQWPQRDTLKYAMKASAIDVDGKHYDVFKQPITDKGKRSKKGRQAVIRTTGLGSTGYMTIREEAMSSYDKNLLRVVYRNGELLVDEPLDIIRERAKLNM